MAKILLRNGLDQVFEIFSSGGFGTPCFWHAGFQERAAFAARFPFSWRRDLSAHDFVQASGSGDGLLAQGVVEEDFSPVLAFDVEDGPFGHGHIEHFFETHGLRTELDFVVIPASFFAAFEIDGIRDIEGTAIVVAAEFDKIGLAGHTELVRHQHHAGNIPLIASFKVRGLIDFFMSVYTFGGVLIVLPDLFDQMQCQSPFTEQEVVYITQRQKIVVVILQRIGQSKSSICG